MKVCLLTGEYPPLVGGVGDYTAHLARALQREGISVAVITKTQAQPLAGAYPFPVHAVLRRWGFAAWPALAQLLRAEATDLVHLQYQTAAYGMQAAVHLLPWWLRRRGYRVLTTFHDLRPPYLFPKAGAMRTRAVALLARSSDAVIAVTEEDAVVLEQWLRSHRTLMRAIPIGSNILPPAQPPSTQERSALRASLGVAANDLLLAYFGLLNQSKGLETLLEALARLRREGLPCRLLVIGGEVGASDPTNRATQRQFQEEVRRHDLEADLLFTGHLPPAEVSLHLAAADLCVLPFQEGYSLRRGSLMAALAHGCAIVTTRPALPRPALPLLPRLVDGEHALLVSPEDPGALAEGVRRLWEMPGLRRRLGEGARSFAIRFDWDGIAAATADLYRALLVVPAPRSP